MPSTDISQSPLRGAVQPDYSQSNARVIDRASGQDRRQATSGASVIPVAIPIRHFGLYHVRARVFPTWKQIGLRLRLNRASVEGFRKV